VIRREVIRRVAFVIAIVLGLASVAAAQPVADRPPLPTKERSLELIAPTAQAPLVDALEIEVESQPTERMPVVSLGFVPREVRRDTVLFHLTIIDELGAQTIEVPRDQPRLYRPNLRVMSQRVQVEVRAVDAGGVRSRPTTLQVEVTPHRPYRCGLGPMIDLAVRGFLALLLVAVVVVVISMRRGRAHQHGAGEAP
jgi:hypothetical protein